MVCILELMHYLHMRISSLVVFSFTCYSSVGILFCLFICLFWLFGESTRFLQFHHFIHWNNCKLLSPLTLASLLSLFLSLCVFLPLMSTINSMFSLFFRFLLMQNSETLFYLWWKRIFHSFLHLCLLCHSILFTRLSASRLCFWRCAFLSVRSPQTKYRDSSGDDKHDDDERGALL